MSPVTLSGKSSQVCISLSGETKREVKQLVQDATIKGGKKSLIIQSQTAFHEKDKWRWHGKHKNSAICHKCTGERRQVPTKQDVHVTNQSKTTMRDQQRCEISIVWCLWFIFEGWPKICVFVYKKGIYKKDNFLLMRQEIHFLKFPYLGGWQPWVSFCMYSSLHCSPSTASLEVAPGLGQQTWS